MPSIAETVKVDISPRYNAVAKYGTQFFENALFFELQVVHIDCDESKSFLSTEVVIKNRSLL